MSHWYHQLLFLSLSISHSLLRSSLRPLTCWGSNENLNIKLKLILIVMQDLWHDFLVVYTAKPRVHGHSDGLYQIHQEAQVEKITRIFQTSVGTIHHTRFGNFRFFLLWGTSFVPNTGFGLQTLSSFCSGHFRCCWENNLKMITGSPRSCISQYFNFYWIDKIITKIDFRTRFLQKITTQNFWDQVFLGILSYSSGLFAECSYPLPLCAT